MFCLLCFSPFLLKEEAFSADDTVSRWLCLEELVENRTSLPSRTLARPTHYFSPWREKWSFASLLKCEMRDMSLALFRFLTTWRIASVLFLMSNEDLASHPENDWKTAFSFDCGTFTSLLFICSLFIFVLKKQNKKAQNNEHKYIPLYIPSLRTNWGKPQWEDHSGCSASREHGSGSGSDGAHRRTECGSLLPTSEQSRDLSVRIEWLLSVLKQQSPVFLGKR